MPRTNSISELVSRAHLNARAKGFWDYPPELISEYHTLVLIAKLGLITEEVGEAVSAVRETDPKLGNLPEELADICIRVFDLAGYAGINLEQAILRKMERNTERPPMHGKRA